VLTIFLQTRKNIPGVLGFSLVLEYCVFLRMGAVNGSDCYSHHKLDFDRNDILTVAVFVPYTNSLLPEINSFPWDGLGSRFNLLPSRTQSPPISNRVVSDLPSLLRFHEFLLLYFYNRRSVILPYFRKSLTGTIDIR